MWPENRFGLPNGIRYPSEYVSNFGGCLSLVMVGMLWLFDAPTVRAAEGMLATDSGFRPAARRSQDDDDPETAGEKSLQQQWVDYLLSPVREEQRNKVLDSLTQAEREDLESTLAKTDFDLDAVAAQVYLTRLCELGPRISGTPAMAVQQTALVTYFESLDAKVERQQFTIPHPETREATELTNLIVQLHPDRRRRILICCHYDTRPYADQDPHDPKARLLGANDGASGVGLLMVLAPGLQKLDGHTGIDLIFFDAEELVYQRQRDPLFLGSTHFARQYTNSPPSFKYVGGVLIDMIGDRQLELFYEKNSLSQAGPITKSVWNCARRLKVAEFVAKPLHQVRDDHLPLNQIAKIPTTDLIDFDYPSRQSETSYWHTREDLPDKCSPVSLAKVGVVLYEWAKDYIR